MASLSRAAYHAVSPEAGDGEFQALLDIWFPEKQPLPTAFLVDTSEEALLLPDWLKLRMIRSEVPRLVDAGKGWAGLTPPECAGHSHRRTWERTARQPVGSKASVIQQVLVGFSLCPVLCWALGREGRSHRLACGLREWAGQLL